ncbi:hypothetical protein C1645_284805 [Glomus cerebriforme]|uniref:Uncharacterized protein n=1 Tax=Glomus cerebriforme TaxID=658196 RepID=A0A397SU99_9GLOM|nr:hypothetical protein C1645_284805 [Glomus cerebriforme]
MSSDLQTTFSKNNVDGDLVRLDNKTALEATLYLQAYIREREENKENPEENNDIKNLNDFQVSLLAEKQKLEDKCKELEKIISNLNKRVSKYQSALGDTKNFRLDDNDKNNSVQLTNDILRLQDALEFYVTNLRPNIEINYKNVINLLNKYRSKTRITNKPSDIPLIKAVLQRHVLETILSYVSIYINHEDSGDSYSLEARIANKAEELILLAEELGKMREGNDNLTSTIPIKIRQQIYSALGNRGFSNNIINEQKICEHDFVKRFKTELNKEMEVYRKISDTTRKEEIEEKAANIILDVIRIFYFRIRTQEPIGQIRWFYYEDKIDPRLMIGKWEDDNLDDFEVDICKFPLIGIELNDDLKRKIYTHAIIHHREINSSKSEANSQHVNPQQSNPEIDLQLSQSNVSQQQPNSDVNSQQI